MPSIQTTDSSDSSSSSSSDSSSSDSTGSDSSDSTSSTSDSSSSDTSSSTASSDNGDSSSSSTSSSTTDSNTADDGDNADTTTYDNADTNTDDEHATRQLDTGLIMDNVIDLLTAFTVERGNNASETWRNFFPELVTTFRDGFIVGGQDEPTVAITRAFYPKWWLDRVGYWDTKNDPKGILFGSDPIVTEGVSDSTFAFTMILAGGLAMYGGFFVGKRKYSRDGYFYVSSEAPSDLHL